MRAWLLARGRRLVVAGLGLVIGLFNASPAADANRRGGRPAAQGPAARRGPIELGAAAGTETADTFGRGYQLCEVKDGQSGATRHLQALVAGDDELAVTQRLSE